MRSRNGRSSRGREMIRPAEQYRQIADGYDRLALDISDHALRSLYLDFAQQWRDVAARAESVDQMAAIAPVYEGSTIAARRSPLQRPNLYPNVVRRSTASRQSPWLIFRIRSSLLSSIAEQAAKLVSQYPRLSAACDAKLLLPLSSKPWPCRAAAAGGLPPPWRPCAAPGRHSSG